MQSAGKRNLRGMSVHGYMGMTFCCALALLLGGSTAFGVTNAIHTDQRKNRPINRVFQIPHGLTRPSLHSTMSAPIQGVLMEVKVAEGALVKKGQILAIMDNRVALAEVKMARVAANQAGEIEHAKYELTLAESLLIRLTALEKANAGAQYELEEARVRRDQATVGVRSAREQMLLAERKLEVTEARLESHNIRAPFSGKIIRIERAAGTTMTPSDDLLTLVNMDSIEAELFLPLQLFRTLKEGKSYPLHAQAPIDDEIRGRLTYAAPVIDSATGTFRCVFTIDNPDHQLPAGFGVRFDLPDSMPHRENAP